MRFRPQPSLGPAWLAALVALAALASVRPAVARAQGIVVDSCLGCHGDGTVAPELALTADRAAFDPGESVTFTLTISKPSVSVGGTLISTAGVGTFEALPGEGLAVNGQGMTHTAPKAAVDGVVTFRFAWKAPSDPGGVDFRVLALAGNGNNAETGDAPGVGAFQWAFGCTGRAVYVDLDRDGYGAEHLGVQLGCEGDPVPIGYAVADGDCDENSEKVHPGASEICNRQDDDCNGEIDENAPEVMMWPDGDGDGYYASQTGTPEVGCGNISGFAAVGGDCDDHDPTRHPGATEVCNSQDDNCDGEVDDHVRPQCGVGWCARYSSTCDAADCEPGPPTVETCNGFDDDCDGVDDNDACPPGMLCWEHECVADVETPEPSDAEAGPVSGDGSAPSAVGGAGSVVELGSSMEAGPGAVDSIADPGSNAGSGPVAVPGSGAGSDSVVAAASSPPDAETGSPAGCAIVGGARQRNGRGSGGPWDAVGASWLVLALLVRRNPSRRSAIRSAR